jgi:hypothetical protein
MSIEFFWYMTLQRGNLIGLPIVSVSYTWVPEECSPKMIMQDMKYSVFLLRETFFLIKNISGLTLVLLMWRIE